MIQKNFLFKLKKEFFCIYFIVNNREEKNMKNYNDISTYGWAKLGFQTAVTVGTYILGSSSKQSFKDAGRKIGLVGSLTGTWWPTNSASDTWGEMIGFAQDLVGTALNEDLKAKTNQHLDSIRSALQAYYSSLEDWLNANKPLSGPLLNQVTQEFGNALRKSRDSIAYFKSDVSNVYTIILLPAYAQVANFHLALIHEGLKYATEWNLPRLQTFSYEDDLKKYTILYVNHCEYWYQKGLDILYPRNVIGMTQWMKRNFYRLTMTINVLDIISLFSLYDSKKYPNFFEDIYNAQKELIPKFQLTRIVTTEPTLHQHKYLNDSNEKICQNESSCNPIDLDEYLTLPLMFQNWLRNINFQYLAPVISVGDESSYPYFVATQNINEYTNAEGNMSIGRQQGLWNFSNYFRPISFSLQKDDYIYGLVLSAYPLINEDKLNGVTTPYILQKIEFYNLNKSINSKQIRPISAGTTNSPLIDIYYGLPDVNGYELDEPQFNFNAASHYFNSIQTCYHKRQRGGSKTGYDIYQSYVFHWEHASVKRKDEVVSDRITIFPAIKSNPILSRGIQIISHQGHTGGNVIYFTPQSELHFKINFVSNRQKYKIRLRYVAFNPVVIQYHGSNSYASLSSITLPSTSSNQNVRDLRYEEFGYADFEINMSSAGGLEDIKIISNNEFILDRIEFIPDTLFNYLSN
uniref:Crystaline entomocidal protoxin n=1 Tax=Bacillus thuringiensis TaxID=1428 RepID=A0A286JNT5_BACTU|nr:Cry delta-endotoxin [Bacillus thuringiensis]